MRTEDVLKHALAFAERALKIAAAEKLTMEIRLGRIGTQLSVLTAQRDNTEWTRQERRRLRMMINTVREQNRLAHNTALYWSKIVHAVQNGDLSNPRFQDGLKELRQWARNGHWKDHLQARLYEELVKSITHMLGDEDQKEAATSTS